MAEVKTAKAIAKQVRIAPRKARLGVDLIRGKEVGEATAILRHTQRGASPAVDEALQSAMSNAEHNYEIDTDNLTMSEAYVNEGVTLKRFRPRAQGRSSPINKRTSHITIVVTEKKEG